MLTAKVLSAMERIESESVFDGFHCGIRNRGVTTRMPTTGGAP